MARFSFPLMLPFPFSATVTGSYHFSALDDIALEDDYEQQARYTAGIFNGPIFRDEATFPTSNVPHPTHGGFFELRQSPELQAFSSSFDESRPEILRAHKSRRQRILGRENKKTNRQLHHDYTSVDRDYNWVSYGRNSENRLPGVSEFLFGKADIEPHRCPRKRKRRESTFEQDPSSCSEFKITNFEDFSASVDEIDTIDNPTAILREISEDCEDKEMNQSSGGSSHQWMNYEDENNEEPDPCPEKYRDPLWEEHFKSEESAGRSVKGKERANPPNFNLYNSYRESEQYSSQVHNAVNEPGPAHIQCFPQYDNLPFDEASMRRTACSPERTKYYSGSPSKVGVQTPKKHVNYSRNFNSPHIIKRDPHALSHDELKRARQSLQRDREALQAARESLASERLQLDADRRNAEYRATAYSAYAAHIQKATGLPDSSVSPHHSFGRYSMNFSEQSSNAYSFFDETNTEGEMSSISSSSSNMLQNLRLDEARRMLVRYNKAWEMLDIRDANVPYPTPSGTVNELRDPNNIRWRWTSPPSTWAPDKIMQVNAEAFFQRGMGIRPLYAENMGQICSLDGLQTATDMQLHELQDYLKKERNRWHPDKLLLRSGGQGFSANNTLMTSPASRAVLQAVNDLLFACRTEISRRDELYGRH